jgi:hypothetical protein
MTAGGLVILAMGPVDALTDNGARMPLIWCFGRLCTDRYSELLIFGGLIYYYLTQGDSCLPWCRSASGSVLVSYIRARALTGMDTKVGVLTRFERYIVLAPALVLSIPWLGVWIIAILANITALQRILDVRRQWTVKNGH